MDAQQDRRSLASHTKRLSSRSRVDFLLICWAPRSRRNPENEHQQKPEGYRKGTGSTPEGNMVSATGWPFWAFRWALKSLYLSSPPPCPITPPGEVGRAHSRIRARLCQWGLIALLAFARQLADGKKIICNGGRVSR
jgi:hypothetical protein